MTTRTRRLVLFLAAVLAARAAGPAAGGERLEDFCFLHISDIHVNPRPAGTPENAADPHLEPLAWVCRQAAEVQPAAPGGPPLMKPAFVWATGDLTEYGVIGSTWAAFEAAFAGLPVKLYVVPGNHDNTWTAMLHVMRQRHGGDHYAFDRFGCRFLAIDSATPQEPVPSIEQRTLTWLAGELKNTPPDRPVFLFMHHPLHTGEFAKPYEQLRLLETLGGHNVALVLMGHGHNVVHERWNTLDSVMGGSTYGPNAGCGVVAVRDGQLRVIYRFRDENRPPKLVLEKPLVPQPVPGLRIVSPAVTATGRDLPKADRRHLTVTAETTGEAAAEVTATVDDRESSTAGLAPVRREADIERFEGRVPLTGLVAGMHFLKVTAAFAGHRIDRAGEFLLESPNSPVRARRIRLEAGIKAAPVIVGDEVIVATTAGRLMKVNFDGGTPRAREFHDAGVEILHAPAPAGERLYLSAAEKGVRCLGPDGRVLWTCDLGAPVYGTPAVAGEFVYAGDLAGAVHAIERQTGRKAWSRTHASFSIEQPLTLHDGVLYFGAWDGLLYAVNAADGTLKWKQPGPAAQSGEAKYKSRYYAPGDCPPVVAGDRLFVCDRARFLGCYGLDGTYLGQVAVQTAAVGPGSDGRGVLARGENDGITRYDAGGKAVWSQPVAAGRFPAAPVEAGGRVAICSNRGRLTLLDASDGRVVAEYQVTPDLHVMAPAVMDASGRVVVAGMDGSVTQVAVDR